MFLIINIMYLVCDIVTFLYASLRYCKPSFGKVNDVKVKKKFFNKSYYS